MKEGNTIKTEADDSEYFRSYYFVETESTKVQAKKTRKKVEVQGPPKKESFELDIYKKKPDLPAFPSMFVEKIDNCNPVLKSTFREGKISYDEGIFSFENTQYSR